jgi:hypothetical protein
MYIKLGLLVYEYNSIDYTAVQYVSSLYYSVLCISLYVLTLKNYQHAAVSV